MARLSISLLGPFQASLDGRLLTGFDSNKVRALLAYLAVEAERPHSRDVLAGLLWPELPNQTALSNLRYALSNLRDVIGDRQANPSFLLIKRDTLQFNTASGHDLDAAAFMREAADKEGQPREAAISHLQREAAARQYRGAFLEGFSLGDSAAFEEWVLLKREQFNRQMLKALRRLADYHEERGEYEQAEPYAWRQVELEPWQEEGHQQLMRLLALDGQRSAALAQYEKCRRLLADELGVEPSAETTALYEQIRDGKLERGGLRRSGPSIEAAFQNRYRLSVEFGQGGMSVVYRAHDTLLDRDVAVKILSAAVLGDEGRARLLREAQTIAKLNHPNIVSVYDMGEVEGAPCIVMELVEGGSLRDHPPQSLEAVVAIGRQVCAALEHAHAHDIIHRDLKPDNVVMTTDGSAKLMDFGLARSLTGQQLTDEGAIVGTFHYLAPEIIAGQSATARSDLYSLGAMLYELAAHRPPFDGDTITEVISQHLHAPVIQPSIHNSEIPPVLDSLIVQLLSKQPEDRPASVVEVRRVLEGLDSAESPVPGEPPFKGLQYFDESDAGLFFGREQLIAQLVQRLHDSLSSASAEGARFLAIIGASGSGKSSLVRAGLVPTIKQSGLLAGDIDETLSEISSQPASSRAAQPRGRGWRAQKVISNNAYGWQTHIITPNAHPLEALAASLTRDSESVTATARLIDDMASDPRSLHFYARRVFGKDGRALLVVDQFEELFTLCRSEDERIAFVDNLLTACGAQDESGDDGPTVVVIALRADFYAHCAQYARLREVVCARQEYIGPMNAQELRRAIEEPAAQNGWEFEPGLVDLILRDVGDEPGALPLLSHALLETWKRRRGRTLTLKGYAEAGGVHGAIARTAETVFNRLTAEQQLLTRRIFLRLTELGEGTQDTRRRAAVAELTLRPEEAPVVEGLLKMLAGARLVTLAADTAEVAHEALIREWPTLREWLAEDREGLRLHRHLTEAAQAWDELSRDPGELYRGARLAQATEWAEHHADDLNLLEREFLDASMAFAKREEVEREAQVQRELVAAQKLAETEKARAESESRRAEEQSRSAKQLRQRALGLAIALLVAGVLAVTAFVFGQLAADRASIATARELALAAVNNLDVDPELSILLALEAASATRSAGITVPFEVQNALHQAVLASRIQLTFSAGNWRTGGDAILDAGFNSMDDRPRVTTVSPDGIVKVWDVESRRELLALRREGHTDSDKIGSVIFSPGETRLATMSGDQTVIIWNTASGQPLMTLTGHTGAVYGGAFSPAERGTRLLTFGENEQILWDVASGAQLLPSFHDAVTNGVAFTPDGTRFVMTNLDGKVNVREAASGEVVSSLDHGSPVTGVAFDSDGARLATAGRDGIVKVWETASGRELLSLAAHGGSAEAVAFSPDGTRLATSGFDGAAVWDVSANVAGDASRLLFRLAGHTAEVYQIAFNRDGTCLITVSADGTAKVWNLLPSRELLTLSSRAMVGGLAFSPDGTRVATAYDDGTAKVWRLTPGPAGDAVSAEEAFTLTGHGSWLNGIAFSPSGTRLATASADRTAKVWDAATGQELLTLRGHAADTFTYVDIFSGVTDAAFSPDEKRVATVGMDGTLRVWDALTGDELLTKGEAGVDGPIFAVAYGPDGTRLATGDNEGNAKIWDAASGELLLTLPGHSIWVRGVAFSPDGTRLASGSSGGTLKVWDASTGAELVNVSGNTGLPLRVAFSPDGKWLATGGLDTTANLWDAATGQHLLSLPGHTAPITGLAFGPDARYLATSGGDSTVRLYALRLEDLVTLAKSRVTRALTTEECQKYLHIETCP